MKQLSLFFLVFAVVSASMALNGLVVECSDTSSSEMDEKEAASMPSVDYRVTKSVIKAETTAYFSEKNLAGIERNGFVALAKRCAKLAENYDADRDARGKMSYKSDPATIYDDAVAGKATGMLSKTDTVQALESVFVLA